MATPELGHRMYGHLFYFSVFFDVPLAIYRLLLLNKLSDKICAKMSKNLDLKSLK